MTVMGKTTLKNSKNTPKKKIKKSKLAKAGKKEFKSTGKRGRLVVRNLPFKCNENELHKHFKPFGEIKDIQLLRRPDNKLVGCGFVEYKSRLNADKALEQLNGKHFLGRPIYIDKAVSRERYDDLPKDEENEANVKEAFSGQRFNNKPFENEVKEEPASDEEDETTIFDESTIKKEEFSSGEENEVEQKKVKFAEEKDEKLSKNARKGRLIVRNLSFKTTEEKLKEHFSKFGEISEVKLLRRPDQTLVGCGFVQFTKKLAAAKAIHQASGKPFLDRPIIVDWAVAKDRFKKMQEESLKKEIKKEDSSDEQTKPLDDVTVKKEEKSDESEKESEEESESDDEEEEESESNDDDEDEGSDEKDDENVNQEVDAPRRQRVEDVNEGKTVFVKNLPFSVTDVEFRECMEQYGPVYYALVCKDKLTEHSKGSGFVKFKEKEDAEKCLSAGTELTLKGTILDPHPALKRDEVQKLNDKSKEKKDNRNLYLMKEGMIIAGTTAARGVSVADMERRLQLEQWKTTKLRNLNMFVSRNRLVIHNLPPTISDKQLSKLFKKHAGPKAFIKETRVMRDLKQVDPKGKGVSKGYGFVSFDKHEDALKALRSINNNPNIFTPTSRPIVAFSIENRSVLNTKTKRMERSRQKNPLCKDYKSEDVEGPPTKKSKLLSDFKNEDQNEPEYAGIAAKPGGAVKMRQKYKLKNQAQRHVQDVKKQKREIKMSRKMRRTEHIKKKQVEKKVSKQKKQMVDNDSAFTKLVDKYKSKILSQVEKKKWYDE